MEHGRGCNLSWYSLHQMGYLIRAVIGQSLYVFCDGLGLEYSPFSQEDVLSQFCSRPGDVDEGVVGHEIPVALVREAEVQVPCRVHLADRSASFELDQERLGPVLVIGQEVSAHPVVVQLYAMKP